MKYVIFALLLATLSANIHAADFEDSNKWSEGDTWREVYFQGLLAVDAVQTSKIARNPTAWREQNNYLGAHPTIGAVNRYFLAGSVLHGAISYMLPEKYRAIFQYVTIGVEAGAVTNNLFVGIGF